jgi:ectoine hydroxylase
MKLTPEQLAQFERDGYALVREVPRIYAELRPEVEREKDGVTPRTSFAAHTYNPVFAKLGRHPRLVEPVVQCFGEDVYMHQFKINAKMAFDGDVWHGTRTTARGRTTTTCPSRGR